MLTMSKTFGHIFHILKEAKTIASLTNHVVEFEFNGVLVRVESHCISEESLSEECSRISAAVRNRQKRICI
jgi:hypothetical protein